MLARKLRLLRMATSHPKKALPIIIHEELKDARIVDCSKVRKFLMTNFKLLIRNNL